MRGQFFVGRPNPESRAIFFSKLKFKMAPNIIDFCVAITSNFTGAALTELVSDLMVAMLTQKKCILEQEMILQCATNICCQFPSLLLGKYNLPELYNRMIQSNAQMDIKFAEDREYSGRIIVDLSEESPVLTKDTRYRQSMILFEALISPYSFVETIRFPSQSIPSTSLVLPYFASISRRMNIDFIQLINLDVLLRNSAYDEQKIKEVLSERMDEVANYNKTLVIFDLDSLVGVQLNESDSNMGLSRSTSIHNVGTFNMLVHYFQDCFYKKNDEQMHWTIAVSSNSYLIKAFREVTKFSPSQLEKDDHAQKLEAMKVRICKSCNIKYFEYENKPESCHYHPGFLYDTKNDYYKVVEDEIANYSASRLQDIDLKYICCHRSYGSQCDHHDKHNHITSMKKTVATKESSNYTKKLSDLRTRNVKSKTSMKF